jgi:hypothetical protein
MKISITKTKERRAFSIVFLFASVASFTLYNEKSFIEGMVLGCFYGVASIILMFELRKKEIINAQRDPFYMTPAELNRVLDEMRQRRDVADVVILDYMERFMPTNSVQPPRMPLPTGLVFYIEPEYPKKNTLDISKPKSFKLPEKPKKIEITLEMDNNSMLRRIQNLVRQ